MAKRIFLTPFHPTTKKLLENHDRYIARKKELVQYLNELKKIFSFEFYDLSDINTFNGLSEEFYDGEHVRSENGYKMLDYILKDCKPENLP